MSGYTKLFNTILASTVWSEPNETRIVWITLLAMADKNGIAEGSVPGRALFARVSVKQTRLALKRLSSPDPESRSKEEEGRRIEVIDGGWRLINHAKYRQKMGVDERREYLKLKQREYRRKQKSTNVNNVSDTDTVLTHAEAEAEAEATTTPKTIQTTQSTVPEDIAARAGRLLERYAALFLKERQGARYHSRVHLDFQKACDLVRTWDDDDRLDKMARLVLTSTDDWIAGTDRGFGVFAARATWADDRIRAWEIEHKRQA